jgi:hypothetical protein
MHRCIFGAGNLTDVCCMHAGPYVAKGGCPVWLQNMIDKACTECSQSYCTERAPVAEVKDFLNGYRAATSHAPASTQSADSSE